MRLTSALLRIGREPAPPKITSSMPEPRIEVGRFSPITQRNASSRFDLPQPLGPTMPVSPGSMKSSVGSTKDLKPLSLRRVNFNGCPSHTARLLSSFFHKRIQNCLQLVVGNFACMCRAIDDEGRRGIDTVPSLPFLPITIDESEVVFVVGTGCNLFLRHARLPRHLRQTFEDVLPRELLVAVKIFDPVGLIRE